MRCLVTGGAGFIGSNLVHELVREGWSVDIVDDLSSGRLELLDSLPLDKVTHSWSDGVLEGFREIPSWSAVQDSTMVEIEPAAGKVLFMHSRFAHQDILDRIRRRIYDIVFHQAAIPRVPFSVKEPILTMQTNLMDTVTLFRVASSVDVPVVWASSSSIYGGTDVLPTHESERGKVLPKSPYAMHKYHAEDYATLFGELYGLRSIGLRYFNVFGPGQYAGGPYSTAVAAWCHAIKNGEECRSDGDGSQTRDMCYIDNVVQANIKAAKVLLNDASFRSRCYNIGLGDRISNREILNFLVKRFGDRVKIRNAPWRPGDVMHTQADISKAREELEYEPQVRFWEGLRRTLVWWGLNDQASESDD